MANKIVRFPRKAQGMTMMNMNGVVKLTVDDVIWYTDEDGEPHWRPKNPEPGKSYCLLIPKVSGESFSGKPLFNALRDSSDSSKGEK